MINPIYLYLYKDIDVRPPKNSQFTFFRNRRTFAIEEQFVEINFKCPSIARFFRILCKKNAEIENSTNILYTGTSMKKIIFLCQCPFNLPMNLLTVSVVVKCQHVGDWNIAPKMTFLI